MATYNGEKFISEQLNSILKQSYQDFIIIIRDDDSTDNTPKIINSYAQKFPDKIKIVHDNVICHDASKNFFQLMTYANSNYVMFSDQDDVWLPDKIKISISKMKELEKIHGSNIPILVYAEASLVDENLNILRKIYIKIHRLELEKLIFSNHIAGCLCMMNRDLYKNIGKYFDTAWHDWFCALFAVSCGEIFYINEITELYRQHENNVFNKRRTTEPTHKFNKIHRITKFIFNPFKKFASCKNNTRKIIYTIFMRANELKTRFAERIKPKYLNYINEIIEVYGRREKNKFIRIYKLFKYKLFNPEIGILNKIKLIMFI